MKFKWTNDLTDQCYQQAIDIRKKVFISEQGVDPDLELDENENACLHCVGYNKDGQPIATARLLPRTPDLIRIQRVAVLANYRHFG
ncbi:hypothetical protein AWM75_06420 [Aerococcus urinaehominis]|uniref:Uncharacterized protein n=1 Tax=Aerococcus urinaehominis TaxID=128944 RepID=A0A0X8FMZ2_9LACT|nr:hypothetical protein [Aerococcus urinaehominis]AMB99637.1 hypothetical protein AWM75_06420 [Aerococcus urinaehominis]SDL88420.1 hypothetical protein SAMN04487985_10282 [Aerococcus urinaehominis]